jgi:hypothetical protein
MATSAEGSTLRGQPLRGSTWCALLLKTVFEARLKKKSNN